MQKNMFENWIKFLILVAIINILATPVASASSYNQAHFFANIGGLIRSDVVFSPVFLGKTLAVLEEEDLPTVGGNALIAETWPGIAFTPISENFEIITIIVTAYSSSVDETDSTPFITASGKSTQDGVIAANFLPFGTKVKIPEYFGDKTFVVEDRMHSRFSDRVDVWFPSKGEAKTFGKRTTDIIVFNDL